MTFRGQDWFLPNIGGNGFISWPRLRLLQFVLGLCCLVPETLT